MIPKLGREIALFNFRVSSLLFLNC